ncbi:rCG46534 [Rattus norvegicus]|uniref:RCG46534 n=1 Tax=Rattus norvegicus TaxID=10116 RepID=A6ICC7_RAT|nr:rCG46534 [Rattus norvegicus]
MSCLPSHSSNVLLFLSVCLCLCVRSPLLVSLPYVGKNRTQELREAGEGRETMAKGRQSSHPHWLRTIFHGGRVLGWECTSTMGLWWHPMAYLLKENS